MGLLVLGAGVSYMTLTAGSDNRAIPYDFNGDDYPDLAAGLPGDTIGGHSAAGSVAVANGMVSGLTSSGYLLNQDSAGVPGGPEQDDNFGQALASGDFDADGYADLAVTSSFEAIGDAEGAGYVTIHYGSEDGLVNTRSHSVHEDTTGVPGAAGWDEVFGYSLAVGDLNEDGYDDLAIGQPLDHTDDAPNAGTVRIVFGSGSGLDSGSALWIDQLTANVPGRPEADDRFGEQIAIGDINGDGKDDLVATTIGEQIPGSSDRGSVHVMSGPFRDAPAGSSYIDSAYIDGIGEFSGSALALGRFNDDSYVDVAIGISDQKVGEDGAAGRLAILYSGPEGLAHEDVELVDQDTPGVAGGPEPEDYFAASLAAGDVDGDGIDDLVVGMRSEALAGSPGAGAATVLFSNADGGISTSDTVWIDQDVDGVPGVIATNDHFGWTVGALDTDGNGRAEPLIGAPGNGAGTVTVLDMERGSLVSATAYSQADLGLDDGIHGDAFGIALPQ